MRYSPPMRRLDKNFRFYEIKRVFLACPGDLAAERSKFMRLLETVNNLRAHSLGFHLQAVGWERVIPSHGRPQSLINGELRTADLVVVMFWNRIGSPASDKSKETGTIEEFKLARHSFEQVGAPVVWVYFKTPSAEPDAQLKGVLDFRGALERGRDIFFREFTTTAEWEEMFREHLVAYLDGLKRWNIEANFATMRPEFSLLNGRFLGEGIYGHGAAVELSIDLDGDGNDEEIGFYNNHGAEELLVTRLDKTLRFAMPEGMSDEWHRNGVDSNFFHIAVKDVNNDGLPEILVSNRPNLGTIVVGVWGFKKPSDRGFDADSFGLIAVLTGQYAAYVLEGGRIRMPFGSIGSAYDYRWCGDHFEEKLDE